MKDIEKILENKVINSWVHHFSRSAHQINGPHEADADLIEIQGNDSQLLAVTIDSISEEISQGLYQDPFTMGWVTVMSNFSDLAAVGARPLGIVIAVSVDPTRHEKFCAKIAEGMEAACQELGVFILGGDTNTAQSISLTGCSFGLVPRHQRITLLGCQPGDVVFLSGWAGSGNALGLVRLAKLPEEYFPERFYRPVARVKEGQLIREYASCCMDTSDGLLITLDQLLRLNDLGFVIDTGWKNILAPEVLKLCERTEIPPWFMTAGIHGEFELVFTVPSHRVDNFQQAVKGNGFEPIRLGVVQPNPSLEFILPSEKKIEIDMTPLRNLWASGENNLSHLIQEFHSWGKGWGLE